MKKTVIYAAIASMFAAVAQAQNENVTWQAPATVSGASDVSTEGLYYGSWAPEDGSANSYPVNGVTFQGYSDIPDFNTTGFDNGYSGFPNPGTGNNNYNTLLQYGAYDDTGSGNNDTITWRDIPGHTYLIEIWVNGNAANRSETITGGANTSATINYGNSAQYIIGTYVADNSGFETITLSGAGSANGDYPQINLLLIRDITQPNVTWQTPANISGDSDVSTQGTYFGSWAPDSSSSLTVNGVTFQNFSDLPDFNTTGFNAGYQSFPNPGTPDNNYNTLLEAGAYEYPGPACTFSWGGMTPGHQYLLEFWVNGNDPNRTETLTGGLNTSGTLNYEPGQYIIGTFVANSSGSETITLNGDPSDNNPQVNLVQVRDITTTTFSNYQSAVISDNPLGYWPLNLSEDTNEIGGNLTASDFSGNGNYGVYYNISQGNLVAGPAPYITNAVSFNTAEVDLSQGTNTTLLDFTGPTTLEAWVQPLQPSGSVGTLGDIIAKGYDSANYQEIVLRQNANNTSYNYFGDFGANGASGGGQNTNWVYLVVCNDGTNDYMYINGILQQQNADTRGSIPFDDVITWAIGNGTSGGDGRYFNGNICQVAIYNYGLTASQVLKHYYAAEVNASPNTSAPIIVTQPQPQASYVGGSATFNVIAVSALPITYQWYDGSTLLSGQTNSTLTVTNLQLGSASYKVVVGNSNGSTTSVLAGLTVAVPNDLEWSANGNNGIWDVTSYDWLNLSNNNQTNFNQGDQVLFNDTAGVPTSVTINGTVFPSLITVNSSVNSFSFSSGSISGSGSLVKEGTSTLLIASSGNFSGTATIGGGSLSASNDCLNSVSGITVSNNATLDFAGSQISSLKPVTVSGAGLNGEGSLYNSGDDYPVELLDITMAGPTFFSGAARWDLASGSELSGPYNLTMDWSLETASDDNYYAQWNSVSISNNVLGITVTNSQAANGITNTLGLTGMDSSFQNPSTVVTICSNAQVTLYSGGFNGSLHLESGATVVHQSAPAGFYGSTITLENDSSFQSFYNSGETTPVDSAIILNGIVHFVIGDHYMDYTNVISGPGGFVEDYYNNAMQFSASNTYTGPTIIGSSGNTPIVALTGNGSISQSSLIFFGGNSPTVGHIDVSGRPDQTLTLASGQTLEGIGGINGSLVVSSGATISPGGTNTTIGITTGANPTGTLAASDNITLDGTTIIKLDGTTNDVVGAAADITYGGTLNLVNISGSPLTAGESFQIFNAANYSGSFTSVTPATPGTGLAWNTSQLSSGIISVVPGPSGPVIGSTYVSGGNFIFNGTGGTNNGPYFVLTSTNLLLPLTNWTQSATGTFNGSGGFSVTNPLSTGSHAQFYIIKQ